MSASTRPVPPPPVRHSFAPDLPNRTYDIDKPQLAAIGDQTARPGFTSAAARHNARLLTERDLEALMSAPRGR